MCPNLIWRFIVYDSIGFIPLRLFSRYSDRRPNNNRQGLMHRYAPQAGGGKGRSAGRTVCNAARTRCCICFCSFSCRTWLSCAMRAICPLHFGLALQRLCAWRGCTGSSAMHAGRAGEHILLAPGVEGWHGARVAQGRGPHLR